MPAVSIVSEDFMLEAQKLIEFSELGSFEVAEIPHPFASVARDKLGYHAEVAMRNLERILFGKPVAPVQKVAE